LHKALDVILRWTQNVLEMMHKRATKMLTGFSDIMYKQRLEKLSKP